MMCYLNWHQLHKHRNLELCHAVWSTAHYYIVPRSHCLIRFGLLGFPEHKARKTKYNYDQRWSIFFVLGGVEIYENRSWSTRENTAFLRIGARVEWSNNVSRGPALCMIHCITFKLLGEMYQMINLREHFDSERKLLGFRPNVFWFVIRPSLFGLPHIGLRWPWYWSGIVGTISGSRI